MGRSATDTVATTPEEVLAGIAGAREQLRRIEQAQVLLAVEWAKHHPAAGPAAEPGHVGPPPRRFDVGARVWRDVAAMGCVHFDEFALAEFAIAAGLTEYAAGKLLREALLLVHLLPRVWQRVLHGGLEVWRARALAADCWGLPPGAVAFIDAQMSRATARITPSAREKVVAEARARFLPEEEKGGRARALETRGIEVDFARAHHGVVPIYGALDFADAQALEAALRTGAQALTDLGSEASLHCRRAWALGDLARAARGTGDRQVAPGHVPEAGARPHWSGKGAPPPQVKLFIHINPPAGADAGPERLVVSGTSLRAPVALDAEQVRQWLTRPTLAGAFQPAITIREAVNFHDFPGAGSYAPSERIRDHLHLAHPTCIFPFCATQAWRCDADHNEPWQQGGATCACNLANLCRRHHRLKTHSDQHSSQPAGGTHATWAYADLGGGEYYWRGPRGLGFIRTPRGTVDISAPRAAPASRAGPADATIDRLIGAAREAEPDWRDLQELRFPPGETLPTTSAEAAAFAERQRLRGAGLGAADPHRLGGDLPQLDRLAPRDPHPNGLRKRRARSEL